MSDGKKKSLYEYIREARLPSGELPPDFELPKDRDENKVIFADGAMDGIMAYHSAGSGETDIAVLTETLSLLGKRDTEELIAEIETYFQSHYALSVIDSVQSWIVEHRETLPPQPVFQLGIVLAAESAQVETVKFGLSLLELFDTGGDEAAREFIFTLGLSDEFTLFALFIISGWEDGNYQIWKLAKLVRGWGKVHAVERLEPVSEDICKWILCSGCRNSVLDSYLALTCAQKCELAEQLRAPELTKEEYRGACVIIKSLLETGGPCPGIEAYEEADLALHRFLQHAGRREMDITLLSLLLDICRYYEEMQNEQDAGEEDGERTVKQKQAGLCAMELCRSLLDGAGAKDIILKEIKEGNLDQAVSAADSMKLDVREEAWKCLEEAPMDRFYSAWYLVKDQAGAERLAALFENILPLEEMASGVSDLLGLGEGDLNYNCLAYLLQLLKPYPLTGMKLVAAAMDAPVVNNRSMASQVLLEWQQTLKRPLCEFAPVLFSIAQRNLELEDGEIRKRLEELIGRRPFESS